MLFKDLDGKYTTMNEYLEAQKPADGEAEADKAEEKTEEKADEKADSEEKEAPKMCIRDRCDPDSDGQPDPMCVFCYFCYYPSAV